VCLIVLGSAVLLEMMQLLTPDRHGRIQDAIEKMAGGAAGIVVVRAILTCDLLRRYGKRHNPPAKKTAPVRGRLKSTFVMHQAAAIAKVPVFFFR
jgi:hypothetical protein